MSCPTHFDAGGGARMVDVSEKDVTDRSAIAKARVLMRPETLAMIAAGAAGKGDVFGVARIAGIMAAKRTADLIPPAILFRSPPLRSTRLRNHDSSVAITSTCRVRGRTGVEMEAMTAAAVAALTVYDMCKSVDHGIRITDLRLIRKAGGRSGIYETPK